MNKKEREAVATMIAEWEWSTTGSAAEAVSRNACSEQLRSVLGITDEDLAWPRLWVIAQHMGATSDDDTLDALDAFIEAKGYQAAVDEVENRDFDGFRAALLDGTLSY